MPISIKNEETERVVRKLATLTGETLTDAIRTAVTEKYERLRRLRAGHSLAEELNAIGVRCAQRPVVSRFSGDEILGYDDSGAPTR